jgi:hypothetical protein
MSIADPILHEEPPQAQEPTGDRLPVYRYRLDKFYSGARSTMDLCPSCKGKKRQGYWVENTEEYPHLIRRPFCEECGARGDA